MSEIRIETNTDSGPVLFVNSVRAAAWDAYAEKNGIDKRNRELRAAFEAGYAEGYLRHMDEMAARAEA